MADPLARFQPARVVRRRDLTEDLAVFWVEARVSFQAGQYVTLALPREGARPPKRPYSVLSAPHESLLELFVERVEGGALTPGLFDLVEGDAVWVRERAAGRFLLDADRTRHVMACTVTGIAPFLSMLRAQRESGWGENRFLVIYGASHPEDHGPYREEIVAMAETGPVTAVPTISRPWMHPAWTGETGRVEDVLRKHLDALGWAPGKTTGYACGNPTMIDNVQGVMARAGIPEAQIREEKYFTTPAAEDPETADSETPSTRLPGPPGGIQLRSVSPPDD